MRRSHRTPSPRGPARTLPPLQFGPFELDLAASSLRRDGVVVSLRPKTWQVLRLLAERAGALVPTQQLLDWIWPGIAVSDSILSVSVRELRRALGDDSRKPHYIETVHRRGYRFIARTKPVATARRHARKGANRQARGSYFVARRAELEAIDKAIGEASTGGARVLWIGGETGIGKSALIEQLCRAHSKHSRASFTAAVGQSVPQYRADDFYQPILDALAKLCGTPIRQAVIEALQRTAPNWLLRLDSVLSDDEGKRLRASLPAGPGEGQLRELVHALECVARRHPLILVLEDLHWCDLGTLDFVTRVAERTSEGALLVIATWRSDEVGRYALELLHTKSELVARRRAIELNLEPLSSDAVGEYVALHFDRSAPGEKLADWVHERSEGNPLFMVALVDELTKMEAAAFAAWPAAGSGPQLPEMPLALQNLLRQRCARLSAQERLVVEAASLVGVEFSDACVAAATQGGSGGQGADAREILSELANTGQIVRRIAEERWPDGTAVTRYRFTNALYQQVLVGGIGLHRRNEWQRRIALRLASGCVSGPPRSAPDHPRTTRNASLPAPIQTAKRGPLIVTKGF